IVIPVYNEEGGLAELFSRLYPALDSLQRAYEVIFVDDGSRDRSVAILREQFTRRPDVTRIVVLARNAGQHMAILAGFEQSRGDYVITLDADLQNPPEEIAKLIEATDESDPRAHDAGQDHRPGLHAAGLPPRRRQRDQPLRRGEHLRACAGLHV